MFSLYVYIYMICSYVFLVYVYICMICSYILNVCDVLYYQNDSTNTFPLCYIRYCCLCESRSGPLSYCFRYAVTPCVSVSFRNLNLTNTQFDLMSDGCLIG